MEKNTEIGTRVQEAIRSLLSKGKIVRKQNEFGRPELYLVTEGISLEDGEKAGKPFTFEMPLALTEEGRDLGLYLQLDKQYTARESNPAYRSERTLRL